MWYTYAALFKNILFTFFKVAYANKLLTSLNIFHISFNTEPFTEPFTRSWSTILDCRYELVSLHFIGGFL